jgi:hypothetical protein
MIGQVSRYLLVGFSLLMYRVRSQFFASIAQPIYQVIGPKYSETWFNLNGRTTATMVIAICRFLVLFIQFMNSEEFPL